MEKRIVIKNFDGKGEYNPEAHLKFRQEYMEKQIPGWRNKGIPKAKIEKSKLQEIQDYESNKKDMKLIEKLNGKVAVIVPAHWKQLPWLRASLQSLKKLNIFILLAYDNHFHSFKDYNKYFPQRDVMMLADSVVMKHRTHFASVGFAYMWDLLYGVKLLKGWGFPYVFNLNGDCILEKPENFHMLFEMLGDNDIIMQTYQPERKYCGTIGILSKTEVLLGFLEWCLGTMHELKGMIEGRLYQYIRENNLTVTPVENTFDNRNFNVPYRDGDKATWYKTVGLRHLHAEQKLRQREKQEPIEKELVDFGPKGAYMNQNAPLTKYYNTGERKFLEEWWNL